MMLVKNHFGFIIYRRYINETFQNKKNSNYFLYDSDKDREKFEKKFQRLHRVTCYIWLWNVFNCKDNNDAYYAYERIQKQKSSPRTNQLNMSLTRDELFEIYLKRNKYLTKENISQISLYKFISFYLIEPKRLSCAVLFPVFIRCSSSHLPCSRTRFSNYEFDLNCLTGQCIRLYSNERTYELGLKGKFQSVLPGIYEIICRIKLDKNRRYLYDRHSHRNHETHTKVECYFYALPDYGIDCECDGQIMNSNWFESNYLLYGNTNWFNQTMGKIQIFHVSNIYFGY